MTPPPDHELGDFLSRHARPALVLHDHGTEALATTLADEGVTVARVGERVPGAPRRWPAVVVMVADALSLRRSASVLEAVGRSRHIAWWLAEAREPALLVPRPDWPEVLAIHADAGPTGGALTWLRAEAPIPVAAVLGQVARDLAPSPAGQHGVVVATTSPDPRRAPPADSGLVVVANPGDAADPERRVPPDVLLTAQPPPAPLPPHHVLGRPPVVVTEPDLLAGPLDEALVNPEGFLRHPRREEATLSVDDHGRVLLTSDDPGTAIPGGWVTPGVVRGLRDRVGVRVRWDAGESADQVRAVAALAMAGVPLTGDLPVGARPPGLGRELSALLTETRDATASRAREEHSVRLRRAALLEHSTLAWRGRLAAAAGVAHRPFPTCSVLVPESADPAATSAQLERQRGVELEVVRSLEEAAGDLVVLLDADEKYGPDVVADLLLARHYSGATVVGMPRVATDPEQTATELRSGPLVVARRLLRGLDLAGAADMRGVIVAAAHREGGRAYATHDLGVLERRSHGPEDPTEQETPR